MKRYYLFLLIFVVAGGHIWSSSHYEEAKTLYNNREYQHSIRLLESREEALEYQELYLLGLNYFHVRDYDKAIETFSVLLSHTNAYPASHYYIARSYMNTGVLEKAEEHVQYALTYFPNSDYSYVVLGIIMNRMEKTEEAQEALEKAVKLNPRNAWARNNLGLFLMRLGNNTEALEHFQAAVEYDSTNAVYYNNLGITYERLKRYEQSIDAYEKALELRPEFPRVRNNLARVRSLIN